VRERTDSSRGKVCVDNKGETEEGRETSSKAKNAEENGESNPEAVGLMGMV